MIDKKLNEILRAKYNPEGSALRIAQNRMLEILLFIKNICEKNNIEYWLDCGTLLGAVRHGGFIPWDDDIDICIRIKDKKRFMNAVLKENNPIYTIQCHSRDSHFYWNWFTVVDLKTEYFDNNPRFQNYKFKGFKIDVFSLEDRMNDKMWRFCRSFMLNHIHAPLIGCTLQRLRKPFVPFLYWCFCNILEPISRISSFGKKSYYNYEYGLLWNAKRKKTTIFPLKKIEFEGYEFGCPNDVDKYLEAFYGNWRDIPSEDKRRVHALNYKIYD